MQYIGAAIIICSDGMPAFNHETSRPALAKVGPPKNNGAGMLNLNNSTRKMAQLWIPQPDYDVE